MRIKNILFVFIVFLFSISFWACGECDGTCCKKLEQTAEIKENPEPWQSLYDEVMRVHDDVMPKMGDINRLNQDLELYTEKNADAIDAAQTAQIETLTTALTKSEKAMWDWMHEFKQPQKGEDLEKVNGYLNQELSKITLVSDLMLSSINDAKTFLDSKKYY